MSVEDPKEKNQKKMSRYFSLRKGEVKILGEINGVNKNEFEIITTEKKTHSSFTMRRFHIHSNYYLVILYSFRNYCGG
ncbi:hypothetical protein E2C01_013729 [Portunus trituberculatus]|uniref:Uncharacterized protein n=1 Tax=Portunus trituberculatus TaxID=210409 RepID=A0A5B7DH09_PORTR|nr:hypothetical protein [Portunus trituberculatus]